MLNCFTVLVRIKTFDFGVCIVSNKCYVNIIINVLDLRMKNLI
jgi:hypothetical protein